MNASVQPVRPLCDYQIGSGPSGTCKEPITFRCTCPRCDREGDNFRERFHSCANHQNAVHEKHLRIRNRRAILEAFTAEYQMKTTEAVYIAPRRDMPDCMGWWCRLRGRPDDGDFGTEWFYVQEFSDAPPSVWVNDINDYIPVEKFHKPGTRWAGPVRFEPAKETSEP